MFVLPNYKLFLSKVPDGLPWQPTFASSGIAAIHIGSVPAIWISSSERGHCNFQDRTLLELQISCVHLAIHALAVIRQRCHVATGRQNAFGGRLVPWLEVAGVLLTQ